MEPPSATTALFNWIWVGCFLLCCLLPVLFLFPIPSDHLVCRRCFLADMSFPLTTNNSNSFNRRPLVHYRGFYWVISHIFLSFMWDALGICHGEKLAVTNYDTSGHFSFIINFNYITTQVYQGSFLVWFRYWEYSCLLRWKPYLIFT